MLVECWPTSRTVAETWQSIMTEMPERALASAEPRESKRLSCAVVDRRPLRSICKCARFERLLGHGWTRYCPNGFTTFVVISAGW